MSLYNKTLNKLIKKNISISTAESCTGGLLASSITKIKDTSKIYLGGYVTYSNELKIRDLGVKKTRRSTRSNLSEGAMVPWATCRRLLPS